MKTRIVCVGNELVKDDGVGARVGRILERLPLPEGTSVDFHPHVGLDFIDVVLQAERLILVDATSTGVAPGTCRVIQASEVEALAAIPLCCHSLGLAEVLMLARKLDPERTLPETTVIGVEAASLDHFGTELSPSVQEALPEAVALTLRELGASAELIAVGRSEAKRMAAFSPRPIEAHGG